MIAIEYLVPRKLVRAPGGLVVTSLARGTTDSGLPWVEADNPILRRAIVGCDLAPEGCGLQTVTRESIRSGELDLVHLIGSIANDVAGQRVSPDLHAVRLVELVLGVQHMATEGAEWRTPLIVWGRAVNIAAIRQGLESVGRRWSNVVSRIALLPDTVRSIPTGSSLAPAGLMSNLGASVYASLAPALRQ